MYKKFHAEDLPKTNYDILVEERNHLDGQTEFELVERLAKNYRSIICQDTRLMQEFKVEGLNLGPTTVHSVGG